MGFQQQAQKEGEFLRSESVNFLNALSYSEDLTEVVRMLDSFCSCFEEGSRKYHFVRSRIQGILAKMQQEIKSYFNSEQTRKTEWLRRFQPVVTEFLTTMKNLNDFSAGSSRGETRELSFFYEKGGIEDFANQWMKKWV